MKFCDFTFAFPALLSAIMLTATYGPGVVNAIVAIGIYNVPIFAKLTRATANSALAREYVLAARAAGRGPLADRLRPCAAQHRAGADRPGDDPVRHRHSRRGGAVLSRARRAAAAASWGRMLTDAQTGMYVAPRLAVYPGLAVALSVLGLNLLGDGLRDALDPRLKARS